MNMQFQLKHFMSIPVPRRVNVLLMLALVMNWNEHVAIGIVRCPGCVPLGVTYIFKGYSVYPELRRSDYCKVHLLARQYLPHLETEARYTMTPLLPFEPRGSAGNPTAWRLPR